MTTDAPPTLAAFLLERYDEEEEAAHDHPGLQKWHRSFTPRWDPARVLAECEAKRRIVELHAGNGATCSTCGDGHDDFGDLHQPFPCPTLRLLAQPYRDHPGFRPEWRT